MKITNRILMIFLLIVTQGFGQTNNKKNDKKMITNDINASNIVEKIASSVKHFDKEPAYFIRPLQSNCVFEILVNDILVYKEYTLEKLASPVNINFAILKSGIQSVTVRMYPIGDLINKTYGEGKRVDALLKKTRMDITVVKYPDSKNRMSLDDEEVVIKHSSPTKNSGQEFAGAGLDFFEYSFTFEAEVPYDMDGWMDGQDLKEIDRDVLEQATIKYYNEVIKIYKEKNKDAIARLFYGDMLLLSQSKYLKKTDIQDIWDETLEDLDKKIVEYGKLENYKMNFYGNGKLVSLKFPSKEPVDSRLRGKSSFWFKYVSGKRYRATNINIDLYLPQGDPLDSLKTIR